MTANQSVNADGVSPLASEIGKDEPDNESHHSTSSEESEDSQDSKIFNDFDWLNRITDDECFTAMAHGPSRSFDFGANGYTASVNLGQELLQLTAPDQDCGLIYVRGSFSNYPNAILARAQRRLGGKSTFGLKLVQTGDSSYEIGEPQTQGYANFRWPIAEYPLVNSDGDAGSCLAFSFVKNATVFQILRLELLSAKSPKRARSDRRRDMRLHKDTHPTGEEPHEKSKVRIRVGGTVRIGCMCQMSQIKASRYVSDNNRHVLMCENLTNSKRLDIQLFINGESIMMPVERKETLSTEIETSFENDIILEPDRATLVVATFSLREMFDPTIPMEMPSSNELREYLGVYRSSKYATDRLWIDRIPIEHDVDFFDLCTVARCLEQIICVNSVPLRMKSKASTSERRRTSGSRINSTASLDISATRTSRPESSVRGGDDLSQRATGSNDIQLQDSILDSKNKQSVNRGSGQLVTMDSDTRLDLGDRTFGPKRDQLETNVTNSPDMPRTPSDYRELGFRSRSIHSTATKRSLNKLKDDVRSTERAQTQEAELGVALIRDIMCHQYVDLQASFWQIRFLSKAHNFLYRGLGAAYEDSQGRLHPGPNRGDFDRLIEIQVTYVTKIRNLLHHSLLWIIYSSIPTGYHVSPASGPYSYGGRDTCRFHQIDEESDRVFYVPIAIWYVIKNCKKALPDSFPAILKKNMPRLRNQYTGPIDLAKTDQPTKIVLLIWYSYGCFDQIYRWLHETLGPGSIDVTDPHEDLTAVTMSWQKKAEKSMATARKQRKESYSDEDESVDRLAFLGAELGLITKQKEGQAISCIAQARRKVLERRDTKLVNSGRVRSRQDKSAGSSTASPWELTCVNHHSRLALWNDPEIERDETEFAREHCRRFLTSDFSFVCSWDMSKPDVASLWWDSDAACVICSTTLDMRIHDSPENKKDKDELALESSQRRQSKSEIETVIASNIEGAKSKEEGRGQKESSEDLVVELLQKQLEQQDKILLALERNREFVIEFDWMSCEPPTTFHLDTWVQSLDDTPELFCSAQTKTVQLRNGIRQYLENRWKHTHLYSPSKAGNVTEDALAPPDWTVNNISDNFTLEEMSFLSVFSIGTGDQGEFHYGASAGRLHPQHLPELDYDINNLFSAGGWKEKDIVYGLNAEDMAIGMWVAYLEGCAQENSAAFPKLSDPLQRKFKSLTPSARQRLTEPEILNSVLLKMKNDVLRTLNDSLLDQDTRHRIFFIQRCSPAIVKAFIYMWHTEAIDTFDDHFRNSSHFFDANNDVWVTSITLSYWGIKGKNNKAIDLFREGRDKARFPPIKVMQQNREKGPWWQRWQTIEVEEVGRNVVEEGSSSLVISGDKAGNWWTCSIVSSILSETAMNTTLTPILATLDQFIHQPASGRCLIFLSFLGALCESVSAEYESILLELSDAIKLGRQVLKRGLDWKHGDEAIQKLKSMLWALEALRIFDDRLSESLDKIKDAKDKMQKYLSRCRRQEELERQYQFLIEDFEKRFGRLFLVHVKMEQKIVQISRYREGALFSIDLVSSGWDGGVFGGLLVAFLIGTLVLARSLGVIMSIWDHIVEQVLKAVALTRRKPTGFGDMMEEESEEEEEIQPPNDSHSVSVHSQTRWPLLHRRRAKQISKAGPPAEAIQTSIEKLSSEQGLKKEGKNVSATKITAVIEGRDDEITFGPK